MLHIVNGDSFAAILKQAAPDADILIWREALYEGPLSVSFVDAATRSARERYFEERGVPEGLFHRYTEEQEAALERLPEHREVVLWFEHDLFDQTMLIYLLRWFAERNRVATKLYLLCIDSFPGVHPFKGLGQLNAEQTASLFGTWREVTNGQLQLAAEAWRAYAGENPVAVVDLLHKDLSALPFLHNALLCHLRRFPSVKNGLNAVEEAVLSLIRDGEQSPIRLFQHVGDLFLDFGMGDVLFWSLLEAMRRAPHPLVSIDGPSLPDYSGSTGMKQLQNMMVRITSVGEAVIRGEADHAALNGLDRWLGGVHLKGKSGLWRWQEKLGKLVIH